MMLKVCAVATQCCQRTALGVACSAVADGLPHDTIFLCGEDRVEKLFPCLCGRSFGGQGIIERLLADE